MILTTGDLKQCRRPGLRGLAATMDMLYTYKSRSGATITGSEDQVLKFIENSPDLTWEFVRKAAGYVPPTVQLVGTPLSASAQAPKPAAPAGPSVGTKILDFFKTNQDTLVSLVRPKAGTPTPSYVPAKPKSGMSNMLMIGGIAAVVGLGLVMFMRRR